MKIVFGILTVVFMVFGISTCSRYLHIDKETVKTFSLAGSMTTLQKSDSILSMQQLLEEAYEDFGHRHGDNSAVFWRTSLYEADNLLQLTEYAARRAYDLGTLDAAYKTGILAVQAPAWAKKTYAQFKTDESYPPAINALLSSEMGKVISSVYEAFNDAISGGAISSEGESTNMALIDNLKKACGRTFWKIRIKHRHMRNAHGYAYIALLYANMGDIDQAVAYLEKSYEQLKFYSDDQNIAIFRHNVKTLEMGGLKKSLRSAITELQALRDIPEEYKYTAGWWQQLQKKAESLGADDVYLGDMADSYASKIGTRSIFWWLLTIIAFVLFLIAVSDDW
jgi:tetratricopeptide (TPR) repeat protein